MRPIALLLLVVGCEKPIQLPKSLTGQDRPILDSPDIVKVSRLKPGPYPQFLGRGRVEWPEVPTTAEVALDSGTTKELSTILLDPRSYDCQQGQKGCHPQPGVKVQYARGASRFEVYICFECSIMLFYGSEGGSADFDPAAPALVRIVKSLFPNDKVIQAMN